VNRDDRERAIRHERRSKDSHNDALVQFMTYAAARLTFHDRFRRDYPE
jgi:hypothetical protein